MSIWGKIVGGAAGFAIGGPIGALLGGLAGHAVDKMRESTAAQVSPPIPLPITMVSTSGGSFSA